MAKVVFLFNNRVCLQLHPSVEKLYAHILILYHSIPALAASV
ncbi:MAG: hypothetical protein ACYDCN_09925 [Bacteroidia bacterium]